MKILQSKQMLRVAALLLCLMMLGTAAAGCGSGKAIEAATLAKPAAVKPGGIFGEVSESFLNNLWDFAFRTSGAALPAKGDKNALYSPISLYYALAMLEEGSAGKTKEDLRKFMALTGAEDLGKELQKLYAMMLQEGESEEQIANAVWFKHDLGEKVGQAWLDQLANQFYASAFKVDFLDKNTPSIMSQWVEQQTRGKIKPVIELDNQVLIVLMNTLYFKANWEKRFSKDNNSKKLFFAPSGEVEGVTFMNAVFPRLLYLAADRFLACEMPLNNGRIDFILPNEGVTPESILADQNLMKVIREGTRKPAEVTFSVPKFSYRDKIDILKTMEGLGLKRIVQDNPDLSVMLPGIDAFVSKISQEAFIDLNEEGVEAAAYTEITVKCTAMQPGEEKIEMHLDRPFIYVISDDAGVPLFVGVVNNPAAKD